jgi:hypothetical protein
MNCVGILVTRDAYQKVVWLDVAIDQRFVVDRLHASNHLFCGHTNGLDAELAAAEIEEVFQVRTQEVDDENVVEALLSKMVDLRNTEGAVQGSVRSILIPQLRSFRLPRFEFDRNGSVGKDVDAFKNDTEGPFANLLSDSIMGSYHAVGCSGRWVVS